MLAAVTPFIFMCRRPQAGTNLKLRDLAPPQGTSHCFKCPGLHLIGLPGASIIAILPYLGRRRLVSDDVWCLVGACACACACACVPVWHEPESDRSHNEEVIPQLQRQGESGRERDHHVQQRSTPISNTMACNGISSIIDASSYTRS